MIVQPNNFGQPWFVLFTRGPNPPEKPNKGHIHVTSPTYTFGEVIYSPSEPSDHTKLWCKTVASDEYNILGQKWAPVETLKDFSRIEFACYGVFQWDGEQWSGVEATIWTGSTWKPVVSPIVDLSNWVLTTSVDGYGEGSYADGVLTLQGKKAYGGAASAYWSSYTTRYMIDLTAYSEVKAHIITTKPKVYLFVNTDRGDVSQWLDDWLNNLNTKAEITWKDHMTDVSLNVSELSGQYYVGFVVNGDGKIQSNKVWLS